MVKSVPVQDTGRRVPTIWGNVPQRNKNFTGREGLLTDLRERITSDARDVTAVLPHALHGLGGVGKTHLAIEYAHRFQTDYELVWWVPADQPSLVRSTLAALAPRLGLADAAPLRVDDAVTLVLDALRRGEPYSRWLLIFDNAEQPELIRPSIPHGPGHVIVTSRNRSWMSHVDTLEVNVFDRRESLEFLSRRVPEISAPDANELAEALGDLPLALEQAGALQSETGMDAQEYLELLRDAGSRLLSENAAADYSRPVAAAWSLSVSRLQDQSPFALELLRRCAFFGPEPISMEMLDRGKYILKSEFGVAMQDRLLVSRAIRELGRYALARIDTNNRTLQVHRLVQKLIRDELTPEDQARVRGEVHQLLVGADPGDADEENWAQFARLLPHIVPSQVQQAQDSPSRQLIEHIVRYLFQTGDFTTGLAEAERALDRWIADSGSDDPDVLILQGVKADILWALGKYHEAYNLRRPTLEAITAALGPDHEETLVILNGHGADLRARGEFEAARELDEFSLARHQAVFGDESRATQNAANNLAVDYSLTSSYARALAADERNLADRRALHGRDDSTWVVHAMAALARDLRQAGQYLEGRQRSEQAYRIYQDMVQRRILSVEHPNVLLHAKELSVARRKAGDFAAALELAQEVHSRYTNSSQYGSEHPDTLAAGINLGNAQRVGGEPEEATVRIEKTVRRYRDVLGPDHPYTFGCALNLALVHRQLGQIDTAEALLVSSLAGLEARLGSDHHYTLTCQANLATARSVLGRRDEALKMGEAALARFRDLLGPDHPHTLVCATNVALDLAAVGREEESVRLTEDTMRRYRRVLGEDHPDVQAGLRGERLDFDFEPPPL